MTNVKVNTDKTKWGVTHHVTGEKLHVKVWCKQLLDSTGYRVHCREVSTNDDGTVTWRADVDSNVPSEGGSSGPGWLACIAIGVGLGFLFGG